MGAEDIEEERPSFTDADAARLIGKTILVGLTTYESDGTFVEQSQFHGIVERADINGVMLRLLGGRAGETWTMPPDMRPVRLAAPGAYTLRSSGEVVVNPDFTATWNVTRRGRN